MSSEILETPETANDTRPVALSWAEELRRVSNAVSKTTIRVAAGRHQLFYLLHWNESATAFGVSVIRGRDPDNAEECWDLERMLLKPPSYATEADETILRLIWSERWHANGLRAFGLGSRRSGEILRCMAQTGRLCPAGDLSPLTLTGARPGVVVWQGDGFGCQQVRFQARPEASLIVPISPPWYVDLEEGVIGPLDVKVAPDVVARLYSLPPLSAEQAVQVSEMLGNPADAGGDAVERREEGLGDDGHAHGHHGGAASCCHGDPRGWVG